MNDLEKLVPPLELCKQIPAEHFGGSVFVWIANPTPGVDPWIAVRRNLVQKNTKAFPPAPTLTEILDALYKAANGRCAYIDCVISQLGWSVETTYEVGEGDDDASSDPTNPATAALRLWLDVEGVKDED